MPSVLSKFKDKLYGREWSFPYNCYEVGHGWTPFCTEAAFDLGYASFKNSIQLYSALYLATQLGLQRKYDLAAFYETFKSILTSSSFISINIMGGMAISCTLRANSDRYYFRTQCYLPAFIASYLALFIERPARRPALAFYLANMASEVMYKWALSRGYIIPMPQGETILFALGMACWLRFVRVHGFGHDPVSTVLKYLIGSLEAKSRARKKDIMIEKVNGIFLENADVSLVKGDQQQIESRVRVSSSSFVAGGEVVTKFLNKFFDCHPICPHKGISCAEYSLIPTISRFMIGYMGKSTLNFFTDFKLLLRGNYREAFNKAFISENSVKFGLFLGTFVGASKAVHCLLRRFYGKQEVWHSALAGGVSGMAMLFSPKATLSTYIIWKCLEQYFFLAVDSGNIKHPQHMICLVYAVSVNILLYIFALEPRYIRPSYMKFIDRLSDHRLHQANRMVLDVFGARSSEGYEDFFPDLDPKYMSREFHELIFNWLIQPYE